MKDRVRKLYLRFLSRFVAGFLCCGRPTVEHLLSLGLDVGKLTEFPYWVDVPEHWSLPPAVCGRASLRLIAIGRLIEVKQFEVAIKAVALTNARTPKRSIELVLMGDPTAVQSLSQGTGGNVRLFSYPFYKRFREKNGVFSDLYASGRAERIDLRDEAEHPRRDSESGREARHQSERQTGAAIRLHRKTIG